MGGCHWFVWIILVKDQVHCSQSSQYGNYLGVELCPLGREHILQKQGESWLGLWDPVRLRDVKAAHGISGLATHSSGWNHWGGNELRRGVSPQRTLKKAETLRVHSAIDRQQLGSQEERAMGVEATIQWDMAWCFGVPTMQGILEHPGISSIISLALTTSPPKSVGHLPFCSQVDARSYGLEMMPLGSHKV